MSGLSRLLLGACVLLLSACSIGDNAENAKELDQEWQILFDGKSTKNWRGFNKQSLPLAWQIKDGTLHFPGGKSLTPQQQADRGDIVFDQEFENFVLKLQWKISTAGNSGIFYLGQESSDYKFIWQTAPEMQILDNHAHPDANKGKNGNRQAGSLYDLIPATPQNARPVGDWNDVEISVNHRVVTHKQNGVIVVQYELDNENWREMVAHSKFPGLNENWANVAQKGLIGLQDHDDPVWFRDIKIKAL